METDQPRILLVEDDELLAGVLRPLLSDRAETHWAASAEEALEALAGAKFDLLIVDVLLPGMDGLELLERAHLRYPAMSSLVVSGQERFDYAVKAIRAGAMDYISKPVAPADLLTKIDEALQRRRSDALERPTESVLAIGAHPDDVEIGCGGILLRHREVGDAVTILTLTGGEAGGDQAVRVRESHRAADLLDARLVLLSLGDTGISPVNQTIAAIADVVHQVKPTTIYTHTQRDVHQDHRNTNRATLVAARGVPQVYAYESPSTSADWHPSRFVAIDHVLDKKLELIDAFVSQRERHYLEPDLLRATARYWSRFGGSRFAEAFEVVRAGEAISDSFVQRQGNGIKQADSAHAET